MAESENADRHRYGNSGVMCRIVLDCVFPQSVFRIFSTGDIATDYDRDFRIGQERVFMLQLSVEQMLLGGDGPAWKQDKAWFHI